MGAWKIICAKFFLRKKNTKPTALAEIRPRSGATRDLASAVEPAIH